MPSPATAVFKNVCPLDCPDTCSMRVTVRGRRGRRAEGRSPSTRSRAGSSARRWPATSTASTAPTGCMHPLRRVGPKGEGRFERISLGRGARRRSPTGSRAIAGSADGPQAILPYSYYGTMGKLQASSLDRRFFHRLGRVDARPDHLRLGRVARLRVHASAGAGSGPTRWRCPSCRFIVNWGSNTVNTNSHLWSLMIEARKRRRDDRHRSTPTAARPPRGPTGTSSPAPAPTPPWPWA